MIQAVAPRERWLASADVPRSVLIVDDDPNYAESLEDILCASGYHCTVAATADQALSAVRDATAADCGDLVALLDVRLGVASGVDLLARLTEECPDLVCVMMTAELDTATAIAALRRGAYDYFDKTREAGTLLVVLERCFEKVRLLRERREAWDAMQAAKDEAETANRAKSEFLATMNHELRTPLNAIIGFSEMMLRGVKGPIENVQYRSYVGDIHSSGTHLLAIIQDILDLVKAEAGKLELCEDVFDLRETMRAVRAITGGLQLDSGLSIVFVVPEQLPLLRADERKTRQVLLNLVGNAVKFTPRTGRIDVAARLDADLGLLISVADTGVGIAAADLERVLKPFERGETALSREHHGTGLGLAVSKAIMELHDGRLELQSELGVGTVVTAAFPAERLVARDRPRSVA
jgi:signal transduction histidine kinase